jgi:hypothetical protein
MDAPDGCADTIANHNRTDHSKQAPLRSVAILQAAQPFRGRALGVNEVQVSPALAASLVRTAAEQFNVLATTLDHTIRRFQFGRDGDTDAG